MNTSKTITRKEYMADSSALHHDFYAQFVTKATLEFVKNRIGLDKLLKSEDKHLNGVVPYFDSYHGGSEPMWLWDLSPVNGALVRELGENMSHSTHTCVGKAAARILIEETKAA